MVSMKDIAKLCGVSVATVSKALNDYSDVGEATKARIRAVAEEHGYFPNSSARALKTNRTYNLGVLFVDEAHSGLTHDFFASVLESFKVRAESRGYDITFVNGNASNRRMSYYEHCRYRGVDGAVIACIDFYNPEVQLTGVVRYLMIRINPTCYIITQLRNTVLYGQMPLWHWFIVWAVVGLIVSALGVALIYRYERRYVKTI